MPEPVQQFFKVAGSHLFVALVTALITVSFALGSYKARIDEILVKEASVQASFDHLSTDLNNLRVEVAKLSGQMREDRQNRK